MVGALESLSDRVVMVTGATSGLGRAVAERLARFDARLVLVARDQRKAEAALASLQQVTGNNDVSYLLADLSSTDDIRRLSSRFHDRFDRLDVLINNAGGVFFRRRVSGDGLEMTFALNHLGYYTLTCLLADVLIKSAPARVVNVASGSHRSAEIDFDDLQMERGYGPLKAYGRSKLANVLFNYELARRLEPFGVTANALHPGFLRTDIAANNGFVGRALRKLMDLWARPVEEGVEAVLALATRPDLRDVSGQYFVGSHPARSSEISYDEAAARRLWQASESLTGVRLMLPQTPRSR